MSIQVWDPFAEAVSLRDAMTSLFQDSFIRPARLAARDGLAVPPMDVCETDNEFVIKASLPGLAPDQVQVSLQGDTVTIRGESKDQEELKDVRWHIRERGLRSFQRSLTLSAPVDADSAQASYEQGVLTLTLPKAADAKPRQIKLSSSVHTGQIGRNFRNN